MTKSLWRSHEKNSERISPAQLKAQLEMTVTTGAHNFQWHPSVFFPDISLNLFLKESILFSASTIVYQGSRFAVTLFAASRLDPEVFGLWNALSLILLYGGLFALGIIPAMNRDVPLFQGKGDTHKVAQVRSVSWGWTLCSSLVVGFILSIVPLFTTLPSTAKITFQWMGLLFVADQLYAYFQAYLKSDKRFGLLSHQQFLFAGFLPLTVIPLVIFYGLEGYILGQAVVMLLLCAFIAKAVSFRYTVTLDRREILRLAKIGLPLLSVALLLGLLITVDRWVILTFLGVRTLGYFSLTIITTGFLSLIPAVISQQTYPRMAETFGRTSTYVSMKPWITWQILVSVVTTIPLVVSLYFLLPTFVEKFMPQYIPGLAAAKIALLGLLFLPLAGGAGNFLSVVNKQIHYLVIQGLIILINLAINITFIKIGMGLEGVALGTALSYLLYSVMMNTLVFVLLAQRSR